MRNIWRFALSSAAAVVCAGQTVSLALGGGSALPGNPVSMNLSLTGLSSDPPSSVEWTLNYSASDFSSATIAAAPDLTASNKSLSCTSGIGTTTCVVYGLNNTGIANGVVATVSLVLASATTHTSSAVQLTNPSAADGSGGPLAVSAAGASVQILQPGLNGFTCSPVTIAPPASSTCTIALSAPAESGGAAIAVTASPLSVGIPASVTIAQGSSSATFAASAATVSSPTPVTLTASYAGAAETFTLTVNPPPPAHPAASFIGFDTATQGNWKGVYGKSGYSIVDDASAGILKANPSGENNVIWSSSTTDVRALQRAVTAGRVAAAWTSKTSFSVDVQIADQLTHVLAVYCLDWNGAGRVESIQLLDANTNAVLDSRTVSAFQSGVYAVWNVAGHVKVHVTRNGGNNAVLSGLFLN